MTGETGVRRGHVVAVVASCAIVGNRRMSAVQDIKIIVQREGRRLPIRLGRVAHFAILRQAQSHVVRIRSRLKISQMATRTLARSARIIPVRMAGNAVIRHRHVRPSEGVKSGVVESRRRPGGFRVASLAVRRELVGGVVRVGRCRKIRGVAAVASVRRIDIIPVVASCAIR